MCVMSLRGLMMDHAGDVLCSYVMELISLSLSLPPDRYFTKQPSKFLHRSCSVVMEKKQVLYAGNPGSDFSLNRFLFLYLCSCTQASWFENGSTAIRNPQSCNGCSSEGGGREGEM
jgi:hypothetical protein